MVDRDYGERTGRTALLRRTLGKRKTGIIMTEPAGLVRQLAIQHRNRVGKHDTNMR
jgi:hypothetical protein